MNSFKKPLRSIFAILISLTILYTDILFAFPAEITMHLHELHQKNLGAGVSLGDIPEGVCVSSNAKTVTPLKEGQYSAYLKIGGKIPFRRVKLNVTAPKSIYASGELVGLRIFNKGLIVTNLSPIKGENTSVCPALQAGIQVGDVITEINGAVPKSSEEVPTLLKEDSQIKLLHGGREKEIKINPVRDANDGILKIGVWVRDSTAGVGTMTYINGEAMTYGALGHSISDSDTGILFDVKSGTIEKSRVLSLTKGKKGTPGQICGSFSSEQEISGTIQKNCEAGIFGDVFPHDDIDGSLYPIGVISQVHTGKASILSTVDDSVKEYEIRILRTMPYQSATKGLAIEITDPVLLQKTGGIVQGMSGSPILQNGKLIGAVTHVFVNDPTRGYGIFIENMLAETEKIK